MYRVCGPKYSSGGFTRGDLNVVGLVVVILFYLVILGVGLLASYLYKKRNPSSKSAEDHMIAGRNIGVVIGIFTMTGIITSFTSLKYNVSSICTVCVKRHAKCTLEIFIIFLKLVRQAKLCFLN